MVVGVVNSHLEAVVLLRIYGPEGQEQEIEAIVDTGFNGWLSLPPTLISVLNLPFRRRGRATLADGSEVIFNIYEGTVIWEDQIRRIAIDEANTDPILGMQMLHGAELTIQVIEGGSVTIHPLPQQNPAS